jgi:hypothetical protein
MAEEMSATYAAQSDFQGADGDAAAEMRPARSTSLAYLPWHYISLAIYRYFNFFAEKLLV